MKYILEPKMLAVDADSTRQEFEDFIDNLLEWKIWLESHSNETIRMLIDKTRQIECECGTNDSGIPKCKIEDAPGSINERADAFKESLVLVLWYTYLLSRKERRNAQAYVLFLKDISGKMNVKFNQRTIFNAYCKRSLSEFCDDRQTPFLLWKYAETKKEIALGASIAACQQEKIRYFDEFDYDFNIQDSFFADYTKGYQCDDGYTRSIINSVANALTESKKSSYHPLREGKQSTKRPKVKCGYNAERRDCTRSIHAHYWKKGYRLLFANLGEHDDMEIANPCED